MNLIKGLRDFLLLQRNRARLDDAGIIQYQQTELKKLLEYTLARSSFYRDLYKDHRLDTMEDFFTLPTINKKIMMDHFNELNTCGLDKDDVLDFALEKEKNKDYEGYYQDRYVVGLSSGTSGNKGIYITPRELTERLPFVFLARSGLRLRHLPFRILFLLRVFSQGFRDINSPLVKLEYMSTMTDPEIIVKALNKSRINILMAPPSLLRLLIPLKSKITTKLKQIVCYAEVLETEEKHRLAELFGVPVIEIYQASEGQIASACKCGNLHINEDLVLIEIYDENDCPINRADVAGSRMMITNLVNYAQPLIRYEMNDMIVLGDPCPCGSRFRTVKRIIGRNDDIPTFITQEGARKQVFPDLFARWIITASDHIREFKVVQQREDAITVYIDFLKSNNPSDQERDEQAMETIQKNLERELAEFGLNPSVYIEKRTIELPKDRSKYKRFECIDLEKRVENEL